MEHQEELDQFRILEEKIGALIDRISSLKNENESLTMRLGEKENVITELKAELDNLRSSRDKARERIQSILDKIGKMDI